MSPTRFVLDLATPLPPEEAWARLFDLRAHSEVIPLTTLAGAALSAADLREGSTFTARTALGPVGVDDVMRVEEFTAPTGSRPGGCVIVKTGRVVRGTIIVRIAPDGPGCRIRWEQELAIRGFPALTGPVVNVVARTAYAAVLGRLLRRSPS